MDATRATPTNSRDFCLCAVHCGSRVVTRGTRRFGTTRVVSAPNDSLQGAVLAKLVVPQCSHLSGRLVQPEHHSDNWVDMCRRKRNHEILHPNAGNPTSATSHAKKNCVELNNLKSMSNGGSPGARAASSIRRENGISCKSVKLLPES